MTTMTIPPKRTLGRRLIAVLLFAAIVLLSGALLRTWIDASSLEQVTATLENARPWLTLWRLALFGVVIGYWPRWIGWIAKKKQWSESEHQHWLEQRGRIAVWWLIIELFVIQNTLGVLFGALA